jgi:hypothetical protein
MVERKTPSLSARFFENRQFPRSFARKRRSRTANASTVSAVSTLIGVATVIAATVCSAVDSSVGNYDKRGLPDPLVLAFYFTAQSDLIVQLIILRNRFDI